MSSHTEGGRICDKIKISRTKNSCQVTENLETNVAIYKLREV